MKKFVYLLFFVPFFSVFGLEFSSDLFISEEEKSAEEVISADEDRVPADLDTPIVKKAYKKEKVIISRDTSALDKEVENLEGKSKTGTNLVLDTESQRDPSSRKKDPSQSVDYGDYEIHWTQQEQREEEDH